MNRFCPSLFSLNGQHLKHDADLVVAKSMLMTSASCLPSSAAGMGGGGGMVGGIIGGTVGLTTAKEKNVPTHPVNFSNISTFSDHVA